MKTKCTALIVLAVTCCGLVCPAAEPEGAEASNAQSTDATGPVMKALTEALAGPAGEYAARAEYTAIIEKFGEVQPYATIVLAEERHIAALRRHFEMRGWSVPADPFAGEVQAPATLEEAAQEGLEAEELNVAMYDRLLVATQGQRDLQNVFTRLQAASREHHLPALRAAVDNLGQLAAGFICSQPSRPRGGGPPPWAGGRGQRGQGGGGRGGCGIGPMSPSVNGAMPGMGHRWRQQHGAGGQTLDH